MTVGIACDEDVHDHSINPLDTDIEVALMSNKGLVARVGGCIGYGWCLGGWLGLGPLT